MWEGTETQEVGRGVNYMGGLENFDRCLDPPDEEWCERHREWKPCYECRCEAEEVREEWEREASWMKGGG